MLMPMNLQFFAEEEPSENTSEVAEQTDLEDGKDYFAETEEVTEEEPQEVEEQPQVDVNRIAANARRQAEEQLKLRDAEYARRFSDYKNPLTGKPIQSEKDYFDALDAQAQIQTQEKLKEANVDPSIINQLIENNPAIRQANQYIQQAKQEQLGNMLNIDLMELSKMDSDIKSFADVPKEVVSTATTLGVDLATAYKVVNYGKASSATEAKIQQEAINKARGKQHMTGVNGVSTPDTGVDIPSDVLSMWKDMFPDKSKEDLKKLYNNSL